MNSRSISKPKIQNEISSLHIKHRRKSMMKEQEMAETQLTCKIAKILDEAKASIATHQRKLKELSAVRSKCSSVHQFSVAFTKTLTPLFQALKRTATVERVVRFVSAFSSARDHNDASASDEFLEEFLKFLLVGATAANKTVRFRACQIISEIILRLPDDSEVSDELWDEVIELMKFRVVDKVPLIRTLAVRAFSRFVNDSENTDILDVFLEVLPLEQNSEVRKTIVLSFPPSNTTSQVIIDCTMDVSESVRKAAYCVIANKFPLQSLSIKHRTTILQRGLADRSVAVSKECLKLMIDQWLAKCCNGDHVKLLKYLDVETYESVGESVMESLLKAGLVKLQKLESIQQFILRASTNEIKEGDSVDYSVSIKLMEPEVSLYWRMVCKHLQMEAQGKGSDAAATMGTEAAIYAAEASDNNDLLDRILPETVSDYIDLVKAHINAGVNYHFASRQLLLLGEMLDFSDATIRKIASSFVQDLLHKPLEHEVDDEGNKVVIGDGINLGGNRDWAIAVARLARKVHSAAGEFEEVILGIVQELAGPCRERTADFIQWMHCLAVTGLLLENAKSFHWTVELTELLQSLLLPGAKHVHLDVQRVSVRCLGLFGLLENKPSEELVKQLRISYVKGPSQISSVACKALFDIGMWHGPQEVDRSLRLDFSSQIEEDTLPSSPVNFTDTDGDLDIKLVDLLYAGFATKNWGKALENDDSESVQAVLGEGFAKILLLLSEKYPSIPTSFHPLLLSKLISLYFSNESKDLRLKQCLSVFFEHYASLSENHKKCLSKAFIPVMRSMWPGIDDNSGGSTYMISSMRKRAIQASRFMLQMMQTPLYAKETEQEDDNGCKVSPEIIDGSAQPSVEYGEEGLAIRIAIEVLRFQAKKTSAEKSYVAALCRILASLHFRSSEQGPVKIMRRLLSSVCECVLVEKDLLKELKQMAERLKGLDTNPDLDLLEDEAKYIFGKLDLEFNMDFDGSTEVPQTPAPCSTRPNRLRRRVRREEVSSDEENSPDHAKSVAPTNPGTIGPRSQRASKTAALSKITSSRAVRIQEGFDEDNDEDSDVTSEDSHESDQLTE
ncbi:condensin complex subunit 3-like isoform X2 [Hibiscus syriacus]|uniref:condensin complex subunit 3-like isoform X2 n=1 Tax=Hibiscus syriacus TaxID=106335 RepID=UPI0019216321|nr:condensin complex subunit 3-like isoform X2 [Hibiscus syriacus]